MDFIKNVLRIVQLFFCLLLTALIGNVIANNVSAAGSAEAAVNYSLFTVVLAWLAAILGLALHWIGNRSAFSGSPGLLALVGLGLDGAATLFTLIAGIVLAAKLKADSCSGDLTKKHSNGSWIGFGSNDNHKRCRELQASTAFMWFLAVSLLASFVLTLICGARRNVGSGGGSAVGSSGPMSQVRV